MHAIGIVLGGGGSLLFLACTCAVFMGGAKILDGVPVRWKGDDRRRTDRPDRRIAENEA